MMDEAHHLAPRYEWDLPILEPLVEKAIVGTTCEDCTRVVKFIESLPSLWAPDNISFTSSLRKLRLSAENCCSFCQLQFVELRHDNKVSEEEFNVKVAYREASSGSKMKVLKIEYWFDEDTWFITKYLYSDLIEARAVANSNNTTGSWDIARSWIDRCSNEHSSCKSSHSSSANRPTRLIFLGTGPTIKPRLVEKQDILPNTNYMTLSHRWGKEHFIQLTTANIASLKLKIVVNSIPKTFRDAMETARRLGVFHLWIDSLCIIQNSAEDWQREASRMADIYTNSYCNIAATAAANCHSGLFVERDPARIQTCLVKTSDLDVVTKIESLNLFKREWMAYITASALANRGWVVQEFVLAPRTLHFGQEQMFWQCKELQASERDFTNILKDRYDTGLTKTATYQDVGTTGPAGWAPVVEEYSRCQLTFPAKDKLVAISGIARNFGVDTDYVAGLWRDGLLFQLRWWVDDKNKDIQSSRPGEYQGPSWSWTAINSSIHYASSRKDQSLKPISKILSIDLSTVSPDKFGKISNGILTIEAALAIGTWTRPLNAEVLQFSHGGPYDTVSAVMDIKDEVRVGETMFCLPLYVSTFKDGSPRQGEQCVEGLIIQPTGRKQGEFERKGWAVPIRDARATKAGMTGIEAFLEACERCKGEISWQYYSRKGVGEYRLPMYRITLV